MSARPCTAIGTPNSWVRSNPQPIPWIWDGLISQDAVTLLSAPEKTGKTTLLSLLLDRRREGGQLLGRAVERGRTILCSEEPHRLWALRQPPLDFGNRVHYLCPPDANPNPKSWVRFIDDVIEVGNDPDRGLFDLLVIDTAMHFLPTARNNPATLRNALNELRLIAGLPAAVLLLHQARTVRDGTRTRGPLTAFADILIDMQMPHPASGGRQPPVLDSSPTRRRHFHGVGRYPGTLQHQAAELNPDGNDYLLLPDDPPEPAPCSATLETVRQLLSQTSEPLTRQEILARWPEHTPPPRPDSLWRTLARACDSGLLTRTGAGNKAEAFRYRL